MYTWLLECNIYFLLHKKIVYFCHYYLMIFCNFNVFKRWQNVCAFLNTLISILIFRISSKYFRIYKYGTRLSVSKRSKEGGWGENALSTSSEFRDTLPWQWTQDGNDTKHAVVAVFSTIVVSRAYTCMCMYHRRIAWSVECVHDAQRGRGTQAILTGRPHN